MRRVSPSQALANRCSFLTWFYCTCALSILHHLSALRLRTKCFQSNLRARHVNIQLYMSIGMHILKLSKVHLPCQLHFVKYIQLNSFPPNPQLPRHFFCSRLRYHLTTHCTFLEFQFYFGFRFWEHFKWILKWRSTSFASVNQALPSYWIVFGFDFVFSLRLANWPGMEGTQIKPCQLVVD